jgi:3'(2'), 5'-bisphosphate nucleotidase
MRLRVHANFHEGKEFSLTDLMEELAAAKKLAVQAGAVLLQHYAEPTSVEWKGKNDPVTAADRAASRLIVDEIRSRFPSDAVLSEEEKDDLDRLKNSRVWVIDPMDGTKEFIARRPEFSVMIGLAIDGVARLGVVYQPNIEKLYYAAQGQGAHVVFEGKTLELHVSPESNLAESTMAMSRSHPSASTEGIRKRLGIERTVQTGSIGLKVGILCEGLAHVYAQPRGTSLWDTCGPEAILREAGGKMTDALGAPFRYDIAEVRNLQGVIATNGILHEKVVEAARAITPPS